MRAEMKALRDKESERASDVPALLKERAECRSASHPLLSLDDCMLPQFSVSARPRRAVSARSREACFL